MHIPLASKALDILKPQYELLLVDKFPSAIVFTTEMSENLIKTPPGIKAQKINDKHYEKLANITFKLTDYLREKGYRAEAIHPMNGVINLTILAQNSGIGFTGLNGLLITPELGPAQKISGVLTNISNLPFSQENKHAWISEYCIKCGECIKACPEDAIIEFETCCGSTVFLFEEKCIGCSQGCTYCIENCPFYTKGYKHIKSKFDKIKTL